MSQPPYPPQGGDDPGGQRPGSPDWGGTDDPTRQFDSPADGGQRDATRQFRPQYGQPAQTPHGPPQYGQSGQPPYPEYGPPQYGQSQGQPPYPEYGQPQYGTPQYGQPQYGPPQPGQAPYVPYGQPPYGQPWGPSGGLGGQPPRTSRNTVISLVVGAVVLVVAIGAGLFFLLQAGDPTPEASSSSSEAPGGSTSAPESTPESSPTDDGGIPFATVTPDGLGDDPDLDELAQECYSGDMGSCDNLYERAERDSLYALYGGTCAGRQGVTAADTIFCTDAFPGS